MIIFLSLDFFVLFCSMELLIGYLEIFPLEKGVRWVRWGGQMGRSLYTMGGRSKRTSSYYRGRGQILAISVHAY